MVIIYSYLNSFYSIVTEILFFYFSSCWALAAKGLFCICDLAGFGCVGAVVPWFRCCVVVRVGLGRDGVSALLCLCSFWMRRSFCAWFRCCVVVRLGLRRSFCSWFRCYVVVLVGLRRSWCVCFAVSLLVLDA